MPSEVCAVRIVIRLFEPVQAHRAFSELYQKAKPCLIAGNRLVATLRQETRSLEQNARMWAMLGDVSRQVDWYGRKLTRKEWKDVFTASLSGQDVVPGIDGGFVVLGKSTSDMSRKEMAELLELIEAFGAQRGVKFSAPEYLEVA